MYGSDLTSYQHIPECKSNKQSLVHLVITLGHLLQRPLLVVHLLVLGHVGLATKVVKVARVRLRVQLGDEGCAGLTEDLPVHLSKVVVREDILDIVEAPGAGLNATGSKYVSLRFGNPL